MTTSEIFSKCLPHTASLTPGTGGTPELTWQDVLTAIQGIEKHHEGFIRYVYLDDAKGRHDFYAGLMRETCSRDDVKHWLKSHSGHLDHLVTMAMLEWRYGRRRKYTDETRAFAFGVSYNKWRRHFKQIYSVIVGAPAYWEDQVLQVLKRRLRR